jgi:hypothetical protein
VAETGFDPAAINDTYSRTITGHIFEAPYIYDHLARPVKIVPRVADGMPEHSDDHRVWTVRLRPGIYFADDPAFKGARRELVAQDYVYTFKRFADPANKPAVAVARSSGDPRPERAARQGLEEQAALRLRHARSKACARSTATRCRSRSAAAPALCIESLAVSDLGAVAREVVEFYGDKIMRAPGGHRAVPAGAVAAFVADRAGAQPRLPRAAWDASPRPTMPKARPSPKQLQGRALPLVDRVEVSIIEEAQPRWLSFLNRRSTSWRCRRSSSPRRCRAASWRPTWPSKGIQGWRFTCSPTSRSSPSSTWNTRWWVATRRDKVALRRAICLAYDVQREIARSTAGRHPARSR